jgi:hypothetical protein
MNDGAVREKGCPPKNQYNRNIMENRNVLIGSIIFVFGSFIMMIVMFLYETYKSKQELEAISADSRLKPVYFNLYRHRIFQCIERLSGMIIERWWRFPKVPLPWGLQMEIRTKVRLILFI